MSTENNDAINLEGLEDELNEMLSKMVDAEVETKDDPGVFSASGDDVNEETEEAAEAVASAPAEGAEEVAEEQAEEDAAEEADEGEEDADEDNDAEEETAQEEGVEGESEEATEEEKADEKSDEIETETTDEVEAEVKGGKRIVVTDGPSEEYKNSDLVARRQRLMAELAELNSELSEQGYDDDDEEEEEEEEVSVRRARRQAYMRAMGMKEDEIAAAPDDAVLCAVEQKVLPTSEPCAFCRGGCASEGKELPGLIDIAADAADAFKGTVLESGYAPNDDIFVVNVKTEDGRLIEAFYTGAGQQAGWVLLNQEIAERMEAEGKDALAGRRVISMAEAEDIATKSIEGAVVGVDAAVFEGYDSWAVQVEGIDGKSYDAYVGLDGTLLGFDEFGMTDLAEDLTDDEKSEVKAIEAELHFKRQFSTSRREELAKEGIALPDGSFPIVNVEDLRNAIQAFGRAKNQSLAKAHIMKRAAQLGKEDLIPDDWKQDKSALENEFTKELMEFELLESELDLGDE